MVALEFVRVYIDDLLCITRASLDDHLQKLREDITMLQDAGLKVNAQKSKFCATETEYLCSPYRWYKATKQVGTSNTCTNTTNWSQRPP